MLFVAVKLNINHITWLLLEVLSCTGEIGGALGEVLFNFARFGGGVASTAFRFFRRGSHEKF